MKTEFGKQGKRICSIDGCGKKHEAKGYCKNHYKSYLNYGDAEYVERLKKERKKRNDERKELSKTYDITSRGTIRKTSSTNGECSVEGCNSKIKAKKLCDMHYARVRRTGRLERKNKVSDAGIKTCKAIGCCRDHYRGGLCNTHYSYRLKYGTPYLEKTVKLCGVKNCEKKHLAKGLCKRHYAQWMQIKEEIGME